MKFLTSMAIAMQTIEKQERLGKLICRAVLNALKNEDNRKDFEKWYFNTYGTKYIWKRGLALCKK